MLTTRNQILERATFHGDVRVSSTSVRRQFDVSSHMTPAQYLCLLAISAEYMHMRAYRIVKSRVVLILSPISLNYLTCGTKMISHQICMCPSTDTQYVRCVFIKQKALVQKDMAHNPSHPRPSSADCLPRPKSSSMLYSMLPSAVQSRLPTLPSLRRSTSIYRLKPRPKSADASRISSGSRTPEGGLGNAMVWSGTRADEELYMSESGIEMSDEEDIRQTDRRKRRQAMMLEERKSGIGWKFANQGIVTCPLSSTHLIWFGSGFNLLSHAAEECSIISRDPKFGNASYARQLYLHAVIYLIRALPVDLTTEEQLSVRSSLPPGVVEPLRLEAKSPYTCTPFTHNTKHQPSLLHRTLASTIVQLFMLFQFILPHLKYLLSSAYQYDRTHKLSERILSGSIDTVDTLGKRGLSVSEAVLGIGDGRVGQLMVWMASWLVEGITGGIHEGLGKGMVIIGAKGPASDVILR